MSHRYATELTWSGSTGEGYEAYDRTHAVVAPPAETSLSISADPAFRGDPARLNPEQLLVAAASSCQLMSFLAVAARSHVDVVAYTDAATAEMPDQPRPMRITRIVLHPVITIAGEVRDARLHRMVEIAHRECFIAHSLSGEVVVEPTFRMA